MTDGRQRRVVVGVEDAPDPCDAIQQTRSFCAPSAGEATGGRRVRVNAQPAPHTHRGVPRPARSAASVRQITGDYRKADDNELPRAHRRPSDFMQAITIAEPPAEKARIHKQKATSSAVREAWLQGAVVGGLVLAIAWLTWLIARGV